jgi:hypothetical protein
VYDKQQTDAPCFFASSLIPRTDVWLSCRYINVPAFLPSENESFCTLQALGPLSLNPFSLDRDLFFVELSAQSNDSATSLRAPVAPDVKMML